MNQDRLRLSEALRARRPREAARVARRLARAGAWDQVVAATLVLHGAPASAELAAAAARMTLPLVCAEVSAHPDDEAAWQELLAVLAALGRADEGLEAWRRASLEGLLGPAAWQRAVAALVRDGDPAAVAAADTAVALFPDDAVLWSMAGMLRLQAGRPLEAAAAVLRALRRRPDAPGPYLTLAALTSDGDRAEAALAAARVRGAPAAVVEAWRARRTRG